MGAAQENAWKELEIALSHPKVLVSPILEAPKSIVTDASSYVLGGVFLLSHEKF